LYNSNHLPSSDQSSQIFSALVDYISVPSIFDVFTFFEDNCFNSFPLHNYLNNKINFNTNELVLLSFNSNLHNLFNTTFIQSFSNKNIFTDFNSSDYNFFPIIKNFSNDLEKSVLVKNNIYKLIEVFPEKVMQLESFDLSGLDIDETVYEVLSTPDTKIYYPEPFVASPSFVHEDL
jgi:hypothetical protein